MAKSAATALPRETHNGTLRIGDIEIPCSNLDNGMRVLSTRGVGRAFGSRKTGTEKTGTGAPQLPPFLDTKNLFPFLSDDLMVLLRTPIEYRPRSGGRTAYGFDATLLPTICEAILDAWMAKALRPNQEPLAFAAKALTRGLMKVGIIALVDEATGYQAEREQDDLRRILEAYVVEEMRPWLRMFPDEFFRQIYRLQGWTFKDGTTHRPQYIGKLINKWIYQRMPPPVLPELQRRNPAIEGRRKHKHHQFLTPDTGIDHLDQQVSMITMLMRISRDKRAFDDNLKLAFPKAGDQLALGTADPVDPS